MHPPMLHGLRSSTFVSPPLDGSLTVPEMYEWHQQHSPNHPLFSFEDDSHTATTITWAEAVQGMQRASEYVTSRVEPQIVPMEGSKPPVVVILASLDTITYFSLLVGILRTGWIVFPIATRNSATVVAELLSQADARHIFLSPEASVKKLAVDALKLYPEGNNAQLYSAPEFCDLFPSGGHDETYVAQELRRVHFDAPAAILHSSGTTGNPKPVIWTHRALHQFATHPCFGSVDLAGLTMSIHAMGMHHGIGMLQVAFAVSTGLVMSAFKPHSPPCVPDPAKVFEGALATKSDFIYCAPTFIETWSQTPEYVEKMANMRGLLFGGGPLKKEIGDILALKGVTIYSSYGSTQCGRLSKFCTDSPGMDWEYFEFVDYMDPLFIDDGHGSYEVVIPETETFIPCVFNTEIEGMSAYATSDLVVAHPTKPDLWKLVGRTDDQIMHSTGLKTNPSFLESILEEDPHIRSAMVFGRGQFSCGVLVLPSQGSFCDPRDKEIVVMFKDRIQPTLDKMNRLAPSHSRISKEMIIIASPSKPLTYTSKGGVKRPAVLADYESEISSLYESLEDDSLDIPSVPVELSFPSVLPYVRGLVHNVMKNNFVSDDVDIFNNGCDSLQATWIRKSILSALRFHHSDVVRKIRFNFVYQYPTIRGLAQFLANCANRPKHIYTNGVYKANGINGASHPQTDLQNLANKYIAELSNTVKADRRDVILLTGSSGSLGINLLAQIVESTEIHRVYAFSRRSGDGVSLMDKHILALRRAGLDTAILDSVKVVLVAGDLTVPDFGLDAELVREIRSSVTHVIHNGWRVDFNLTVSSFDVDLKGAHNLINFVVQTRPSSPPRLLFTSSIGVFQNSPERTFAPEEAITDANYPLGSGYSESKWIVERMLSEAAARTKLRPIIVRLGQLAGSENGAWNENEWLPSMIKSSVILKCLPNIQGALTWVSCRTAANALLEMRDSEEQFLHLVHPKSVPWPKIINEFAIVLNLPVVAYADWLSRLESAAERTDGDGNDYTRIPALRLLDYFRRANQVNPEEHLGGRRVIGTDKAMSVSTTLSSPDLPTFGAHEVRKCVSYWMSNGFLSQEAAVTVASGDLSL